MKTKNHVILAVEKKVSKKLQDPRSFKKVALIDHHVCCAYTGLNADARVIVDKAKLDAQSYRLTYDEIPSINYISREISGIMQKYTQKGGARPFGLSIMIAGIDPNGEPQLHQIDPSGMVTRFKANSIGKNAKFVNEHLEKNYKAGLGLEDGLKLIGECLNNNIDHPKKNSYITVISKDSITFLNDDELNRLFDSLQTE